MARSIRNRPRIVFIALLLAIVVLAGAGTYQVLGLFGAVSELADTSMPRLDGLSRIQAATTVLGAAHKQLVDGVESGSAESSQKATFEKVRADYGEALGEFVAMVNLHGHIVTSHDDQIVISSNRALQASMHSVISQARVALPSVVVGAPVDYRILALESSRIEYEQRLQRAWTLELAFASSASQSALALRAPAFLVFCIELTIAGLLAVGAANTTRHGREERLQLHKEIERREEVEKELRRQSMQDPLTGLNNRIALLENVSRSIEVSKRNHEHRFALLFVDLDGFKLINDTLGHDIGDTVLVETAERLHDSVRAADTLVRFSHGSAARLGGDEFAILLDGISNPGRAILVAERIRECLAKPYRAMNRETGIEASIGIAVSDSHYGTPEDLLRHADIAMYRAKEAGGAKHAIFDEAMFDDVRQRLEMENELRVAIERQELEIMYQPIVDLRTGELMAFESLVRWNHHELGSVSPTQFIEVAEDTGLIQQLGSWVLETACRQLAAWNASTTNSPIEGISVNVSPMQIGGDNLVQRVEDVLRNTGVPASQLRLEITETMLMRDAETIRGVLHELKRLGVQIYMDDFGTGYSSLS